MANANEIISRVAYALQLAELGGTNIILRPCEVRALLDEIARLQPQVGCGHDVEKYYKDEDGE